MTPPREGDSGERPHVVFWQRVVPPERGASGDLAVQLASAVAQRTGCRVTFLTTTGDPRKAHGVEMRSLAAMFGGLPRASPRLAAFLGAHMALRKAGAALKPVHTLVTLSDPPLSVVTGSITARLLRCRHIHWNQDLYPDAAAAAGMLRANGLGFKLLNRASLHAMKHCQAVLCPGRCMAQRLVAAGLAQRQVHLFPNWSDCPAKSPVAGGTSFRKRLGVRDKALLAIYSGHIGRAHEFETFLSAMRLLPPQHPMHLLFVGAGPRLQSLSQAVRDLADPRVQLLNPVEKAELPTLLDAADLHLVSLQATFAGISVPSKVYNILSRGRPVLYVGPPDTEIDRLIVETDCGFSLRNGAASEVAGLFGRAPKSFAVTRKRALTSAAHFTLENATTRMIKHLGMRG